VNPRLERERAETTERREQAREAGRRGGLASAALKGGSTDPQPTIERPSQNGPKKRASLKGRSSDPQLEQDRTLQGQSPTHQRGRGTVPPMASKGGMGGGRGGVGARPVGAPPPPERGADTGGPVSIGDVLRSVLRPREESGTPNPRGSDLAPTRPDDFREGTGSGEPGRGSGLRSGPESA
jgi:hypothetical protein